MTDRPHPPEPDEWSEWLLHRRHADDPAYEQRVRGAIERFRDRVLDGAGLQPDSTLADIGAGDGLIAFGAIDRVGPSLRVILTDISTPLLAHAEGVAIERGVRSQCTFLRCPADRLAEIPDSSVDAVTTRAVLAYVADKPAALAEFHRILKPGGRMSIGEPVFQDDAIEVIALRKLLESKLPGSDNPFLPLLHRWKAAQFPDTPERMAASPIANFSERDLLRLVTNTGFREVRLALHIDVLPSIIHTWEVFLHTSPHPWAPPVAHILEQQFTAEERQLFEQVLRPSVESPESTVTERVVYITASKPCAPGA